LIQSIRDNPKAAIFAEPLGVVTFDANFARYIKELNKEKEKLDITKESEEEVEKLSVFMKDMTFFCFHGDHRRAAISFLKGVGYLIVKIL